MFAADGAETFFAQVANRPPDGALAYADVVCDGLIALFDFDKRLRIAILLKIVRKIEAHALDSAQEKELSIEAGVAIYFCCGSCCVFSSSRKRRCGL